MELSYGVSYIVLWLVSSWPLVQDMGAELPSTTKCLVYLVTMWPAERAQIFCEQVAQLVTGGSRTLRQLGDRGTRTSKWRRGRQLHLGFRASPKFRPSGSKKGCVGL